MTGRRGNVSRVAITVAAASVTLLVVMLAARSGPHSLIHGHLGGALNDSPNQSPPAPQINLPGAAAGSGTPPPHQGLFHFFGRSVAFLIYLCVAIGLFWVIQLVVRELISRFRPPPAARADVDFDILEAPERVADAILDDADDQLALLLGGTPRNAIVACWDRFEEQGERVGVARKPWETSSEYTIRLLDLVRADPAAVARLERLYHEARFSDHEIDESRRDSAVEALEAIHLSLGTTVGHG
jgi:hypothetical protein